MFRSSPLVVVFALLTCAGCFSLGTGSFDTLLYPAHGATLTGDELVVLLHGRGGDNSSFERHGWIDALRAARPQVDAVAPNAPLSTYRDRSLVSRVEEGILAPAAARGVDSVWLVGVSMGGMGALLVAREHPEQISGAVIVAPFLGDATLHEEIAAAGGLLSWEPGPIAEKDWQRAMWAWLKEVVSRPDSHPSLILAYPTEDRFITSDRLLAAALPPERVVTRPGKHRDRVFAELWDEILKRGLCGDPR